MRDIKSADEIQLIVQHEVDKIQEIIEDNIKVTVSKPQLTEIDKEGCNWNISVLGNGTSYLRDIGRIIDSVRFKYNLQEH